MRGDTPDGPRIVKVAADGERHLDGDRRLWAVRTMLPFAVAEPYGWDAATQSAWYAVVPGRPLAGDLLTAEAVDLITRLGAALAGLARAPVVPAVTADPADQLARSRRAAGRAARAAPDLTAELSESLAQLQAAHEHLPKPLSRPQTAGQGVPYRVLGPPRGRASGPGASGVGPVRADRAGRVGLGRAAARCADIGAPVRTSCPGAAAP